MLLLGDIAGGNDAAAALAAAAAALWFCRFPKNPAAAAEALKYDGIPLCAAATLYWSEKEVAADIKLLAAAASL